MRKKYRVLVVLALYVIVIFVFTFFFLTGIRNIPLFLLISIGSVAILSTSTIYTVIQSNELNKRFTGKKQFTKLKTKNGKPSEIIEEYFDALPSIEDYVESTDSYEDSPIISKYIFSVFSHEELYKINLLNLSKMEKIMFIREMLYYNPKERAILIEDMLKHRDIIDDEIIYTSPIEKIELADQIRVFIRSLTEPGEKTKIIIIDTSETIGSVKKRIGLLFDYNLERFLLSSGGIILNEKSQIQDYDLDDDDEIALIPRKKGKLN